MLLLDKGLGKGGLAGQKNMLPNLAQLQVNSFFLHPLPLGYVSRYKVENLDFQYTYYSIVNHLPPSDSKQCSLHFSCQNDVSGDQVWSVGFSVPPCTIKWCGFQEKETGQMLCLNLYMKSWADTKWNSPELIWQKVWELNYSVEYHPGFQIGSWGAHKWSTTK